MNGFGKARALQARENLILGGAALSALRLVGRYPCGLQPLRRVVVPQPVDSVFLKKGSL
jgi:hypothetical protein